MYKKVIVSFTMIFMLLLVAFNSFVYAERYDTGDKVIYTDKYGRPSQIIDKSTFSQASEETLEIENVCAIVFVICLVVAIIIFNYMDKNEKHNDPILENALVIVCVIGGIALLLYGIIYLGSGGWSAH